MLLYNLYHWVIEARCDRIVVSTLRCGRNNPGLNPGHIILFIVHLTACPLQYYSKYVENILLIRHVYP